MPRGYLKTAQQSLYYSIREGNAPRGAALILLPFGEERRCALRTAVRLQQTLADQGVSAGMFDLSGTGDSSGRHEDATLVQWQEETAAMVQLLGEHTDARPLHIIALRSGALLSPALPCQTLTLVEPLFSGADFCRELERRESIKALAGPAPSVDTADNVAEYAGFSYSREMLRQLRETTLSPQFPAVAEHIHLVHLTGGNAFPKNWSPYLEHPKCDALLLKDRPFWGLTDYFESTLPSFLVAHFFSNALCPPGNPI